MTRLLARALTVLAACGALTGAATPAACDREPTKSSAPAVDTALMAFLSEARALHHEASVREAQNDLPGAIAALERLVATARPGLGGRPETEEVLADTYARLAELRTRTGDLARAEKDVGDGLAHAPGRTYFRGHLFEVSGIVEEARASTLADGGKTEEANAARAKAVELLRKAVAIQEEVIQSALDDGGRPSGDQGGSKP